MTGMSEERLAECRRLRDGFTRRDGGKQGALVDAVNELDRVLAEIDRLRAELAAKEAENKTARMLVKELRGMVIAAHEAGEIFVHVELGEGGKLLLKAADNWLATGGE